jgi:SAM-dependent methyltransferase
MSDNPYRFASGRGFDPAIELAGWLGQRARRARYQRYLRTMKPQPGERLLDVGSGGSWSLAELDPEALVTGVDLVNRGDFERPNQRFVAADASELPFDDDSFDLGYSNSLIEHLPTERRQAFADELRRVAHRYWVQTPNYWFPIEPHALLPGVQFLPPGARRTAWRLSPRGVPYEESLHLLSRAEFATHFDDALILEERTGPLVKSLIAVGPRHLFRPRSPAGESR